MACWTTAVASPQRLRIEALVKPGSRPNPARLGLGLQPARVDRLRASATTSPSPCRPDQASRAPNFCCTARSVSGLSWLTRGKRSRQWKGRQASMIAREFV